MAFPLRYLLDTETKGIRIYAKLFIEQTYSYVDVFFLILFLFVVIRSSHVVECRLMLLIVVVSKSG